MSETARYDQAKYEAELPRFFWATAAWRAWYCPAFYADAATRWRGVALGLLLALVTVEALTFCVGFKQLLDGAAAKYLPPLRAQLPVLEIEDGRLRTPEARRYEITEPDGRPFLIIDAQTFLVPPLEDNQLFLGRGGYVVQRPLYGTISKPYPPYAQTIDQDFLDKVERWARLGPWVALPVMFLGLLIYRSLLAILFAAVMLHRANVLSASIGFDEGLRAAVVALTPPVLISCAMNLLWIDLPYSWSVLLGLFLIWAVVAASLLVKGICQIDPEGGL